MDHETRLLNHRRLWCSTPKRKLLRDWMCVATQGTLIVSCTHPSMTKQPELMHGVWDP